MFYPESFPSIHSLKILCRTFPTRGFVVVFSFIVFVVPSSRILLTLKGCECIAIFLPFSLQLIECLKKNLITIIIIIMIYPFCSFTTPAVKLITAKRKCTLPLSTFVIPVMAFLINLPVSFNTLLHLSGTIK